MSIQTLVQTGWLAEHLEDGDLRIFDSTVFLRPSSAGSARPYTIESGRDHYDAGHIPGAGFLDLTADLSDRTAPFPFTAPPPEVLAEALASRGLTDGCSVVVYSAGSPMWATRTWWMLRALGIDRVAVLDGGWKKWRAEARPTSTAAAAHPSGPLAIQPRPELWASLEEVEAAIGNGEICTINALSPATYDGSSAQNYGRPGHIPGSVNVHYDDLLDPDTGAFLSVDLLREAYRGSGALSARRAINYCGGGISATMGALALTLLGHADVAVYDGSMSEWAADPGRPLVIGPNPG